MTHSVLQRVDLVSDVVCPWCVIGYRQLAAASAQTANQLVATASQAAFEMSSTGRITTWLRIPTRPFSRRYPRKVGASIVTTSWS